MHACSNSFVLFLTEYSLSTTDKHVAGDVNAQQLLECLSCICVLYGESIILLQYFAYVRELVSNTLYIIRPVPLAFLNFTEFLCFFSENT